MSDILVAVKYLEKIRNWSFLLLVVFAPFSFVPSFALPLANFTSFRIGAYQLLALVFVMTCILDVVRDYIVRRHTRSDRLVYGAILLLGAVSAYTLTDAIEPARSLLMTASFCFLLVLVLCARWYITYHNDALKKSVPLIIRMGIFYGVVSFVQLAVATFSNENVLLCKGCGDQVFGFVRINGFAAEPLFWANALLPFWTVALYAYTTNKSRLHLLALSVLTMSAVLTFSRGAYLAYFVVGILYFVHKRTLENARALILIGVVGVLSMGLLVLSSSIRYRDSEGIVRETVSGIVEHLSFGRWSIAKQQQASQSTTPEQFESSGYVEASTNERTGSANLALTAWRRPANTLFGVGLGNLGPYVVQNIDPNAPSNLTVYIYYILLLAEVGIVGLVLVLSLYASALKNLWTHADDHAKLVGLILVGFLVHYLFFGSYINVVYIWLWLGVGLGYHSGNGKAKHKVASTIR